MTTREARNRRYLTDLFAGPFPGHAIIMDPLTSPPDPETGPGPGDFAVSDRPLHLWADQILRDYEVRLQYHEALDDDSVPHIPLGTGTEIVAAAFGCPVHIYDDSPPCARPLVTTAAEADRLRTPPVDAPPLDRVFALASLLRERVGPEVPLRVPDVQSPFDIAALVWKKEELFVAMYEDPEAVKRLVGKCHDLLRDFLVAFEDHVGECSFCHCPNAWAPPRLGCWLSEDEAGCLSVPMFEEFCLPSLIRLSEAFGGLFVHCCATADHQYGSFLKIPNLRGMNRVFQAPGPRPAIEAFSGRAVLMVAWTGEEEAYRMLDMALPNTRFLFNLPAQPLDDARRVCDRLRARCPRRR